MTSINRIGGSVREKKIYITLKRALDIVIGIVFLVLSFPFIVIFSILLLIFSGRPVFFKQVRTGLGGKSFTIWKFRTMQNRSDTKKKNHHEYHWQYGVPDEFVFKTPSTQKITSIGKVYRKLSIDELPQLLNVVKGDMSLVGPRPEIPAITKHYNREQNKRLQVKPGITGYAQVNGRSINTHGEKISYDLYYVDHQNLLLDIKILWKTVRQVVRGKGAE